MSLEITICAESPKIEKQMLRLFEQSELQYQYAVQIFEEGEGTKVRTIDYLVRLSCNDNKQEKEDS